MAQEYKAYLIRLQRNNENTPWRASLKNAHTGELLRFANERDMLRYLMQTLGESSTALDQDSKTVG